MEDYSFSTLLTELMSNHQRNLTSSKKTLKTKYKLANVNETIERADLQLSKFGMTLVGFEDNMCCSYKDADRLHIIRTDKITNNELLSDNVFSKSLVLVLSILFFEHNHISLVKLNEMVKDHISVKQLDVMKAKHYIAYKEENEQVYVNFGWRYYLEFKDFNPTKILNALKMNEMSQTSNLE